MIVSGPGLSPIGGQFPGLLPMAADRLRGIPRSSGTPMTQRRGARDVTLGARVIKIYSNNTPNPGSFSDAELTAIVESAKRHGVGRGARNQR